MFAPPIVLVLFDGYWRLFFAPTLQWLILDINNEWQYLQNLYDNIFSVDFKTNILINISLLQKTPERISHGSREFDNTRTLTQLTPSKNCFHKFYS